MPGIHLKATFSIRFLRSDRPSLWTSKFDFKACFEMHQTLSLWKSHFWGHRKVSGFRRITSLILVIKHENGRQSAESCLLKLSHHSKIRHQSNAQILKIDSYSFEYQNFWSRRHLRWTWAINVLGLLGKLWFWLFRISQLMVITRAEDTVRKRKTEEIS